MDHSKPPYRTVLKCIGLLVTLAWSVSAEAASLTLSWADNSPNERGFRVERKANNGSFVTLATVGAGDTSYTDYSLIADVSYCYRVSAFNAYGFSSPSNLACATATEVFGGSREEFDSLPSESTSYTDYDGDSRADYGVYRNGSWSIRRSTDGRQINMTLGADAQDIPVPGDYDGDGRTDAAVYDIGTGSWVIAKSSGGTRTQARFGGPGFIPVPSDYDGDGKTDIAVYHASTGNWFFVGSSTGYSQLLSFGGAGYIPVPGDYDGDGVADVAVYQQSTGNWFIRQSTAGFQIYGKFGGSGYIPVPSDYDGDGRTDAAVYQQSTGNWFILESNSGFQIYGKFGGSGYIPVPSDYDGDGATDIAVYQRSTGNWFLYRTTYGYLAYRSFGGSAFLPVHPQLAILGAMGLL